MQAITYRTILLNECDRIQEIDPKHDIINAWRMKDGKRQLVAINYFEKGWPDGYERYRDALFTILKENGIAFGAFNAENKMVGFVSLDMNVFGNQAKYVLLDAMFVSYQVRGKGIGKKLFEMSCEACRTNGVDRLYICAGSAEDTIAFYRKRGCVDAVEVNQALYEQDPRDIQLEFVL